jgi:ParB-like chromosome segregation protein Spo0J
VNERTNIRKTAGAQAQSWRDVLPIHPAAELLPRMSSDELRAQAGDIKKNGLQIPIAVRHERNVDTGEWSYQLLDGISRLDAIELAGFNPVEPARSKGRAERGRLGMACGLAPFLGLPGRIEMAIQYISLEDEEVLAYVISANIHRRHLAAEQKRELTAAVLKATPEKSDRQIAKIIKASPTFVGRVRSEKEATGDVSTVDTRTDTKGRRQPAKKRATGKTVRTGKAATPQPAPAESINATGTVGSDGQPGTSAIPQARAPEPMSAKPQAAEEVSLPVLIIKEWRAAQTVFENLARHPVAQIALAIPSESRAAAASLATEFASVFRALAARLSPGAISAEPDPATAAVELAAACEAATPRKPALGTGEQDPSSLPEVLRSTRAAVLAEVSWDGSYGAIKARRRRDRAIGAFQNAVNELIKLAQPVKAQSTAASEPAAPAPSSTPSATPVGGNDLGIPDFLVRPPAPPAAADNGSEPAPADVTKH